MNISLSQFPLLSESRVNATMIWMETGSRLGGRVNSGVDIRQPPRTTSHSCRTASTPPTSSKHNSIPLHSIEGGKSACLSLGNAQNSTVYMITSWVSAQLVNIQHCKGVGWVLESIWLIGEIWLHSCLFTRVAHRSMLGLSYCVHKQPNSIPVRRPERGLGTSTSAAAENHNHTTFRRLHILESKIKWFENRRAVHKTSWTTKAEAAVNLIHRQYM